MKFNPNKHFVSTDACSNGHVIRYRTSGACVECAIARAAKRQKSNSEEYKAYQRRYQVENRARLSAATAEREKRAKLDPEKAARIDATRKAATLNWQRSNPGAMNANNSKRRAARLQRTPKWADLEKVRAVYENCPDGMTVDHIYPLQGELVSGLHVHNNLQYLTPFDNFSKNNRVDPKLLEWEVFK